jgi:hypothetical protein
MSNMSSFFSMPSVCLCHDKFSDHEFDRFSVSQVYCYNCKNVVPIGSNCIKCNFSFGRYYCDKCKFISGNPFQQNYHCDECLNYEYGINCLMRNTNTVIYIFRYVVLYHIYIINKN